MKGLEISKNYYLEYGAPMLAEKFPDIESLLAVGLVGAGSECFGYDDEISRDHDFEPGFCIFVPDRLASERKTIFELERAYSYLPKEYLGVKRQLFKPVGGARHGVMLIGDFYESRLGLRRAPETPFEWLSVPHHALAEAVNGEVFRDDLGEFSAIRRALQNPPRDFLLKKLAGHLLLAAQAGQYNYPRCISHGERAAAQLALAEFARHFMAAAFALSGRYMPFYKWAFRALAGLSEFASSVDPLEFLISSQNDGDLPAIKQQVVEDLCASVVTALKSRGLSTSDADFLEPHAYAVNKAISDPVFRDLDILAAV